mgnify:CR=1 FL=1
MEKYKVGIIGGTGMVGQRFVSLLDGHPWFRLAAVAGPYTWGADSGRAVSVRHPANGRIQHCGFKCTESAGETPYHSADHGCEDGM